MALYKPNTQTRIYMPWVGFKAMHITWALLTTSSIGIGACVLPKHPTRSVITVSHPLIEFHLDWTRILILKRIIPISNVEKQAHLTCDLIHTTAWKPAYIILWKISILLILSMIFWTEVENCSPNYTVYWIREPWLTWCIPTFLPDILGGVQLILAVGRIKIDWIRMERTSLEDRPCSNPSAGGAFAKKVLSVILV